MRIITAHGEVGEWFNPLAWKASVSAMAPRVRISVSPPTNYQNDLKFYKLLFCHQQISLQALIR